MICSALPCKCFISKWLCRLDRHKAQGCWLYQALASVTKAAHPCAPSSGFGISEYDHPSSSRAGSMESQMSYMPFHSSGG